MSVANRIVIKYGLENLPNRSQIVEFYNKSKEYLAQNKSSDEAGHLAAKEVFPDYRSRFYKSEADTLEMLLRLIESE